MIAAKLAPSLRAAYDKAQRCRRRENPLQSWHAALSSACGAVVGEGNTQTCHWLYRLRTSGRGDSCGQPAYAHSQTLVVLWDQRIYSQVEAAEGLQRAKALPQLLHIRTASDARTSDEVPKRPCGVQAQAAEPFLAMLIALTIYMESERRD